MLSERIWERYEDVTRQLLLDIKDYLGLSEIEQKQLIQGNSGTEWEVDVVAYDSYTGKLVLVECRHRKNSKLNQSAIGGFAYIIKDTNAERGIIVTTIGLQEGAKKITQYEKITEVKLEFPIIDRNFEDYVAKVSNQIFVKLTDQIAISFTFTSSSIETQLPCKSQQYLDFKSE